MKLPSNFWTKERCHEEALKYIVKKPTLNYKY